MRYSISNKITDSDPLCAFPVKFYAFHSKRLALCKYRITSGNMPHLALQTASQFVNRIKQKIGK